MVQRMIKPNEGTHVDSSPIYVSAPQVQVAAPQIEVPIDIAVATPVIEIAAPSVIVGAPNVDVAGFTIIINLPPIPRWSILTGLGILATTQLIILLTWLT